MKRLALAAGSALLLLVLLSGAAWASGAYDDGPPPPPMALYGDVTIGGLPAPVGTVVDARGAGVKRGIIWNPITTTLPGRYGGPTLGEVKLGVQGWITDSAPIYIYVNGWPAQVSVDKVTWGSSVVFRMGVVSRIHLRAPRRYYFAVWREPWTITVRQ
jgi:hypothetical protein